MSEIKRRKSDPITTRGRTPTYTLYFRATAGEIEQFESLRDLTKNRKSHDTLRRMLEFCLNRKQEFAEFAEK